MNILLHTLILFISLMATYELFRRSKWITWIFFLTVPFILIPLWVKNGEMDWFRWVKIYSVVAGVLWFNTLRHTKLKDKKWAYNIVYLILATNILEAVIRDLVNLTVPSILNGMAGILLIITMGGINSIYINEDNPYKDLCWKSLNLCWIIGYTIWNWVFIYLSYPEHCVRHIALLGAALVVSLIINKESWLQARATTLGICLIYSYTFSTFVTNFNTPHWENSIAALVMGVISILYMLTYGIIMLRNKKYSHIQ